MATWIDRGATLFMKPVGSFHQKHLMIRQKWVEYKQIKVLERQIDSNYLAGVGSLWGTS